MLRGRKVTNDPSRFDGEGISYRAKLIGIEDVKEARGDQMCQEAIIKLKNAVRVAGAHKRKIIINISLQGIKITDAISLVVLHSHAVHQVSFISRDSTDNRAFGYICETEDGLHKYFAIKTALNAEQVVLALRDLFQVVFEAKRKETEPGKDGVDKDETTAGGEQANLQTSEAGLTCENGQTSPETPAADSQQVEQVVAAAGDVTAAAAAAAASPEVRTQPVANLFDFEEQSESIVQGVKQINSLELEFLTNDAPPSAPSLATSPLDSVRPAVTAAATDPWGLAATDSSASKKAPPANSSALDDLAGIQTSPFSISFSMQSGFSSSFNPSLPAGKDQFSSDAFTSLANRSSVPAVPGPQQQSFPTGFTITNPFGSELSQPFGVPGVPPRAVAQAVPPRAGAQAVPPRAGAVEAYGMFPGVIPHGITSTPIMGGVQNPFAAQQPSGLQSGNPFGDNGSNLFQTDRKDPGGDSKATNTEVLNARAKSPHDHLFGDLLDIKQQPSVARAKSPRDMFAQAAAVDKKSMNDLIAASPRASPVPAAWLKPSTSPRASPVPAALLKPGTSPRASPVPMVQNVPSSPLLPAQTAPTLSAQASADPFLQAAPRQPALLDDFFCGSTENQVGEKSLFD